MKKLICLISVAVAVAGFSARAATLHEWTFDTDPAGRTLANATNTVSTNRFSAGGAGFLETDGLGTLRCTFNDSGTSGVWTNGALLSTGVGNLTNGTYFIRYDLEYDINDAANDSGTLAGLAFTDTTGAKVAGVALQYDAGAVTTPTNLTVTDFANLTNLNGKASLVAKVDMTTKKMDVWYDLTGTGSFSAEASPQATNITVNMTSINNLRLQMTGDFTNSVKVGQIQMSDSFASAIAAPPELLISVSNSLSGLMDIGNTNIVSVIIRNNGGRSATSATSILTNNGVSSAFTISSNNPPQTIAGGLSITNTYGLIANTNGTYHFTIRATSTETNSAQTNLTIVAGAQISYLTNSITEVSGGYITGQYELGETISITITSTNNGARTVTNIINTLSANPAYFKITPASSTYPSMAVGGSRSTTYTVAISNTTPRGNYTFYVTNSAGSLVWTNAFAINIYVRVPNTDRVKANNASNLNTRSSWVGSEIPDSTERAIMDGTVTAPIITGLGTNLSWRGIALVSNTASWTISGTNTLNIGSAGINMAQAQADLTIASKLAMGTTQTWNVVTSRTLTVSGAISGTNTAPLVKTGAGTLIITNRVNSYSGNTIVSNGTLSIANTNVLGANTLMMAGGSTLATTGGSLLNNRVELTNSVTVNNATDLTLAGTVSGSGSLTKLGAGKLFLAGTNTYSGGTTNFGFIQIGNPSSLGSGTVAMQAGSILHAYPPAFITGSTMDNKFELTGATTFSNNFGTAGLMSFSGDISGSGSLKISGYQCYLRGNNTFSGGLDLDISNWFYFEDGALGSGTITTKRAALLSALESATITNNIVMSTTLRINPAGNLVTISGPMSGAGQLQLIDLSTGILAIPNANPGRTNTTLFNSSRLLLGNGNALGSGDILLQPDSADFSFEVSKNLTGTNRLANNLSINGATISLTTGIITPIIFNLNYDLELSGRFYCTISDLATIEKYGAGALILSGSNEYTNPVNVIAGSLVISNSVFNSTLVTVNPGAALKTMANMQTVTMGSGATLEILNPAITFNGDLSIGSGSLIKLPVNNAASALRGNGGNALAIAGALNLDFSGNGTVASGNIFTVLTDWGSMTDNGLDVRASGLPNYLTVDASNLFVDGTVTISPSRLKDQNLEITVPVNGTASGTITLTNSTAGALDFTVRNDGTWLPGLYTVTTQGTGRAYFNPAQFDATTVFTSNLWIGTATADQSIGFEMPVYGTKYTDFSVSQYGFVTLRNSSGETAVLSPFRRATTNIQTSVRFKKVANQLIIAWGNGAGLECQAWLNADGTIQYLYQYGTWGTGNIGLQDGSFTQPISHVPGVTDWDSLLLTPSSWVTNNPEEGRISAGGTRVITFTANATNQSSGEYFFPAKVTWQDGQTSKLDVFVTVTDQAPKLVLPSPFTFWGSAGLITKTNMVVTNSGNAPLTYTVTDSGLQGASYNWTNTTYGWRDIPAVANYTLSAAQLGTQNLNLGFPFVYFGNVYTSLTVNANGTLTLGSGQTISPFGATMTRDANASVRFLADLNSTRFTVTWENMAQSGGGSNQTFQAMLNRDGSIQFNYNQLGSGWPVGVIALADSSGNVSGTLSNSSTTVTTTNITPIYSNVVTVTTIGNNTFTDTNSVKIGATTNVVTTYTSTANYQSLKFTPGKLRIISASPITGTIPAGGTTNIQIIGDARSLTPGAPANSVTTNTTLTFSYSGISENALVTFIATNSSTPYPSPEALADMWGADPVFTSQQNADGSRTISWSSADDGESRTYRVWYKTSLSNPEWTKLDPPVVNGTSYVVGATTIPVTAPAVFFKVTVE